MQRIDRIDKHIRDNLRLNAFFQDSTTNFNRTLYYFHQNAAAIRNRDINRIKYLCEEQAVVYNLDESGHKTLLDIGSDEENEDEALIEIVTLLLKQNHSEKLLRTDSSVLDLLAKRGHRRLLELVINHYNQSHLDTLKKLLPNALITAACYNQVEILHFLLDFHPDIYDKRTLNRAFYYSIIKQNENGSDNIDRLLKKGAEINKDLVENLFYTVEQVNMDENLYLKLSLSDQQKYSDFLFLLLFNKGEGRDWKKAIKMANVCLPLIPYPEFQKILGKLNLTYDAISEKDFPVLSKALERIPRGLQKIKLSEWHSRNAFQELVLLLQPHIKKSNLRILNLSQTGIDRDDMKHLGSFLQQYKQLEELYLNHNPIGGKHIWRFSSRKSGVEQLTEALHSYPTLRKLSLNNVGLDKLDSLALINLMDSLTAFFELQFEEGNRWLEEKNKSLYSEIEKMMQHARDRAELLGYPLPPDDAPSWQAKLKQVSNYYIAPIPTEERKEDEEERANSLQQQEALAENSNQPKKEGSWQELYDLTREIIEAFVPGSPRQRFIEAKEKQHQPLSHFEGLQWRALHAQKRLKELILPIENNPVQEFKLITEIRDIWEDFIIGDELNAYISSQLNSVSETPDQIPTSTRKDESDTIPIVPEFFKDWLKVCMAAYEKNRLQQLTAPTLPPPEFPEWPDELNSVGARWFHAQFHWTLHALWIASGAIHSKVIPIGTPLTKREQVEKQAREAFLHALLAVPAIGELGHALFHGVKAFHALGNLGILPEVAHTIEFMEDIPPVHHFFHSLGKIPRRTFESFSKKRWLNTDERLENFYKSFAGQEDFNAKVSGIINKFIHHFGSQLKQLDPTAAGQLGHACAQHLAQALMLGLLRGSPTLSLERFISLSFRWLTYIPMESAPWLELSTESRLSADTLLRGAGLQGQVNNQRVTFYWSASTIESLDTYRRYQWQTHFPYQVDAARMGYRLADEQEVNQLNSQLQAEIPEGNATEIILGQETGKQIARLSWQVDPQVLAALRKQGITSVTAVPGLWRPADVRIRVLEETAEALGETIKGQAKTIEGQGETIRGQGETIKDQGDEIKKIKKALNIIKRLHSKNNEEQKEKQAQNHATMFHSKPTFIHNRKHPPKKKFQNTSFKMMQIPRRK